MEGAKAASLAFRIAALGLSVAAAVVMGTASGLLLVDGSGGSSGRVVSYSGHGALKYFVAAGAVSAVCAAVALYWFVHGGSGGASRRVWVLDAAAQALLFSASGAALAARGCFAEDGAGGAFSGRAGTAAAMGACAAVSVSASALLGRDAP